MLKSRLGSARAHSLRSSHIAPILVTASLILTLGISGHLITRAPALSDVVQAAVPAAHALTPVLQSVTKSVPVRAFSNAGLAAAAAIAPKAENVVRDAELDDGQSFAEFLSESGAADNDAQAAMNALSKVYDLRHLQAGQNVTLFFSRTDKQETFTGATFLPEATKEVSVARNIEGTFVANVKLIPVVRQRLAAQGEINSSLSEAGDKAGVPHAIMAALIRVYSHDVDFQRDIHPGDSFQILYDQSSTVQGKPVGEGSIIYASITVGGKVRPIYRVSFNDGTSDYFDERGQSIRRALLRTPVAAARITSSFGMRMHPLLGYSKMHKGVDFGAPIGAPIFAAGSGTVEDIGFRNGYGRYIRIRHNGTIETAYAHMSRFAANMYRGAHVNQGEVIAYVGMSGRVTGPHLHYEVHVNGQQVNPMSVNLPTGRVLEGKLLADFRQGQAHVKQEYAHLVAPQEPPMSTALKNLIQASTTAPAYTPKLTSND